MQQQSTGDYLQPKGRGFESWHFMLDKCKKSSYYIEENK